MTFSIVAFDRGPSRAASPSPPSAWPSGTRSRGAAPTPARSRRRRSPTSRTARTGWRSCARAALRASDVVAGLGADEPRVAGELGMVDLVGRAANHTGEECLPGRAASSTARWLRAGEHPRRGARRQRDARRVPRGGERAVRAAPPAGARGGRCGGRRPAREAVRSCPRLARGRRTAEASTWRSTSARTTTRSPWPSSPGSSISTTSTSAGRNRARCSSSTGD